MGHVLGAEKLIFLIRDIDDATTAAAPVESCQFVVLRCPWGRFGSEYTWLVAYTACARARGIIDQFSHHYRSVNHELLGNGFQSLWGPQESAHAVQATTHYQTYLERPPGADTPPKKVCNLDPMAPRPRKKRQFF